MRALRRHRHRADEARVASATTSRSPGLVREAALRALDDAGADLARHRRGRHRQGARHVRGRDDARALPRRRARRRGQADDARAHRRQRRRLDGDRRGAASCRRACTSACSRSPSRSSRRATRCGRSSPQHPVPAAARRRAPAATSRRIIRAYIRRSGAPADIGMRVAVKDRLNALKNPYAHLHMPDITLEKVRGVADAVGSDPLPRDVPVVRRRLRDGARRARTRAQRARRARRRGCAARRCAASRRCSPGATR